MNQDKDNLLVLRAENDPPIKVEVRRVAPMVDPEPSWSVDAAGRAARPQGLQEAPQRVWTQRGVTVSQQHSGEVARMAAQQGTFAQPDAEYRLAVDAMRQAQAPSLGELFGGFR